MCLGIPGEVLSIDRNDPMMPSARVSFSGVVKQVCLSYAPEAQVGDYVVVHVGFAISRLDPEEARKTLHYLEQIGETAELEDMPGRSE